MTNMELDFAEAVVLLLATAGIVAWLHFSFAPSPETLALAAGVHVTLIGYVVYTLRKQRKK